MWHKTTDEHPSDDTIVIGFYSGEDYYVALCYYDDGKWYDCEMEDFGNDGRIKQPDYWIEIPDEK